MQIDHLCLFNKKLAEAIAAKNDDELWSFLLENEEKIKQFFAAEKYPRTKALFAYPHGIEWLKKHFRKHIEDYREGMIYTLVLDFCFPGETIRLDYWGQGGYLDNADSCDVKTSDEIMPPVDEEAEPGYYKKYFHLLEPRHVKHIIESLEKNLDKLTGDTREDIDRIKEMRKFCLQNDGYHLVYIYNN